ncbi:MAG: ABC-F family ATP-binding cassette domain-containing protein [Bacteroidaceae bacterium]|nr:ABC-F family ATP-binding cassette domain-containing protein [Bacteroidaceae bacterium]
MISIENLKVEFGATPLFQGVSYIINPKDRIALVGKNGAGKSTMLKILAGLQQPTDGTVAMPKDITVSYLPQVMKLTDTRTVREETELAFAHIGEQRRLVDRLGAELAERTDYESDDYHALIDRFAHENERLQIIGGDSYHAEMEQTLCGLGFSREDLDRPTAEFSGGWRMRIELAKLLLQHPDVLLLDEPTNHLDIESIQWLEGFLARSAKAVVLVSHDRAFINNVTNRTIEITCGTIHDYRVKYDEYVELRRERREQQLRAYENQQKEIADITDFIERFRYKPTKAIQVQSRIKQLEKIVPVVIDEEDRSTLRLKFRPAQRSGNYPIICEDVTKIYTKTHPIPPCEGGGTGIAKAQVLPHREDLGGSHLVFKDVNLTIRRGEKVAFVGKNGEGKSTLVKCIMGEIPYEGKLTLGHNVEIGYFAQNQAQLLDEELTVFDTIDRVAVGDIRLKIRDILGAFMFGGEASDKKVKVLSGGERSRLAMIKLLLEQVNLLILDEPTNHLDMRSKDVLKEAIRDFDGTVIIVSHDREFLDGLVTKVYEFGGGKVREHLGGIYDYLQRRGEEEKETPSNSPSMGRTQASLNGNSSVTPSIEGGGQGGGSSSSSYAARKEQAKAQRKLQKRVEECEKRVTQIEAEIKELEEWMATPTGAANQALFEQYAKLKATLAAAEAEWEEAMMEMEDR